MYLLDLSMKELEYVIEADMTLFQNLHTLSISENTLPFAKLGLLPSLKKLDFSWNGLKSLDLEVDGRFNNLEHLNLSYNNIDRSAMIVLATLPKLKYLDLTRNKIKTISSDVLDMSNWKDRVIELILPFEVAALQIPTKNQVASEQNVVSENADSVDVNGVASTSDLSEREISKVKLLQKYGPNTTNIGLIGFPMLHTLILDHNPIGLGPGCLDILSLLPK